MEAIPHKEAHEINGKIHKYHLIIYKFHVIFQKSDHF